jgi:hypothetical protein
LNDILNQTALSKKDLIDLLCAFSGGEPEQRPAKATPAIL